MTARAIDSGTIPCQWCDGIATYRAGVSPLCVETQYRCRECGGETWHDDRQEEQR